MLLINFKRTSAMGPSFLFLGKKMAKGEGIKVFNTYKERRGLVGDCVLFELQLRENKFQSSSMFTKQEI